MTQPDTPAVLREKLLDQLAYLLDELDALQGIVHRVPEPVLVASPLPGDLSIKALYGLLAVADRAVFYPAAEQLAGGQAILEAEPDIASRVDSAAWNARSMDAILAEVRAERQRLVGLLTGVPLAAWQHTPQGHGAGEDTATESLFDFVFRIIQHDADVTRTVGYRLHESHLTTRKEDLPK